MRLLSAEKQIKIYKYKEMEVYTIYNSIVFFDT